jgi:hypothetical protein
MLLLRARLQATSNANSIYTLSVLLAVLLRHATMHRRHRRRIRFTRFLCWCWCCCGLQGHRRH